MSEMICWLIGGLMSISIYLILSPQMMRWLFGIVILSSTINLVILVVGRLDSLNPAFTRKDMDVTTMDLVNPLPQALILTAIVISFGLLAFSMVLLRKVWRTYNSTNTDIMSSAQTKYSKVVEDDL